MQSIFTDHNAVKVEIKNRKTTQKFPNTWKLSNTLLSNPWVKEEVSREIKKRYIALNENANTAYQNL